MTGLDLESFSPVLRADLTTWVMLGLATLGLAFLVWSCWHSRRALRKCLVLSLAAHLGLVLYGSTIPAVMWALGPDRRDRHESGAYPPDSSRPPGRVEIGRARVHDRVMLEPGAAHRGTLGPGGRTTELADASLKTARPKVDDRSGRVLESEARIAPPTAVANATPKGNEHAPRASPPEPRPESASTDNSKPPAQPAPLPVRPG